MKKIIAICCLLLFVGLAANAQTSGRTKVLQKKTTKAKILKALDSKSIQAKVPKAKKEMRKEGE
ncbi:MAG TPA: hypothetical protein VER36_12420 [Flavisolibacter sp.]|nr:hypothetical protein [Flavisolibacter sp.]